MKVSAFKLVLYVLFAALFTLYKVFPLNSKRVVFVLTHDSDPDGTGNLACVYRRLKNNPRGFNCHFITRKDYNLRSAFRFFFVKSFLLATAKYVLLDNVFLPSAFLAFKKPVKVVQLWHGSGTIKKFGQDATKGLLHVLERRGNRTYTHLIVNSGKIRDVFSSAFGIGKDKIYAVGSPRTDLFFSQEDINRRKEQFFAKFPHLIGKRIYLYAPTFRDEDGAGNFGLDFGMMERFLEKDSVLLVKLHPWLAGKVKGWSVYERILDFSGYHDIHTLMLISDVLITDYSSLIFEYVLLKKPIVFFAYDLQEFKEKGRGFYEDYESYVPGPIVKTTPELIETLRKGEYDLDKVEEFAKRHYDFRDGKSTDRVIRLIFDP